MYFSLSTSFDKSFPLAFVIIAVESNEITILFVITMDRVNCFRYSSIFRLVESVYFDILALAGIK